MTKDSKFTRIFDSASRDKGESMAREIREDAPRYKHDCDSCLWLGQFGNNDLYACSQGGALATIIARYGDKGEQYMSGIGIDIPAIREGTRRAVLIAIESRISNTTAQSCEARPGVNEAVESHTADEKGLASRVEELENLIAKHSGSLNSADSASNTESSSTAKETR